MGDTYVVVFEDEFQVAVTDNDVSKLEGPDEYEGRFFELLNAVRILLCEYTDVDPEIEGFRISVKTT